MIQITTRTMRLTVKSFQLIHTTGNDRTKFSAAFSANANGKKLPVSIIILRITDSPNFTPPDNVLLVYKSGATFDTHIIIL
jgi:hypothetical protein